MPYAAARPAACVSALPDVRCGTRAVESSDHGEQRCISNFFDVTGALASARSGQ